MTQTFQAVYQGGVLRPLERLDGVVENETVQVTLSRRSNAKHPLADVAGIMPDEDAKEILAIIETEFEQVDLGVLTDNQTAT